MKLVDKITLRAERLWAITSTQVKHHAPQIEFGIGAAAVVVGGCLLFMEGRKSKEKDFKAIYKSQVEEIEKGYTPKSIKAKAKRSAAFKYARSEVSNVAPGVATTLGGLLFMKRGFGRVMASNRVLEAALAASVASGKKMADIITEHAGVYEGENLINGSKTENVEVKTTDPDGKYRTYTDSVTVIHVNDIFDLPGESFIYSKETCTGFFQDDDYYINDLVDQSVKYANRKLQNTHGYVFSDEIVKLFGVDPKPLHKTCGCVMPDPKRPRKGDDVRKCCYDFNTRKIQIEYDDGSRTNGWLITPVDDGSIIDIYSDYSLQRLLAKNRLEWANEHKN